jgi:hypothetical protein
VHPAIIRSLNRPTKAGFRAALTTATTAVKEYDENGVYKRTGHAMAIDLRRLDRAVTRILKGTHFLERGYVVPEGYSGWALSLDGLRDADEDTLRFLHTNIIDPAMLGRSGSVGAGTMNYWFAAPLPDPHVSVWVVEFYNSVRFVGATEAGVVDPDA